MKSKISIELDFENNNQPVIQVVGKCSVYEPDVRDNLVQAFLQAFQGGEYAKIRFLLTEADGGLSYSAKAIITPMQGSIKEPQYFSRWSIGDKVDYTTNKWIDEALKNKRVASEEEVLPQYSYGKISAVRFTEAKVYYDILDDFTGKVVRDIHSDNVKNLAPEFSVAAK